jgi:putative ABC transport system permease protein
MDTLRIWVRRFLGIFQRSRREAELTAELQAHLDLLAAENIRRGMSPDEARHAARRAFGGVEQSKQAYRDQRGIPFFDALAQDLRFAARGLVKNSAFAIVAILMLALGIGSTTAVFSVVDRILFRSLPYPHDGRLVSFGLLAPIERDEFMLGSSYVDFRRASGPFEAIAAMAPGTSNCDVTEQSPVRLVCATVEQTFLSTLGVAPLLGRNFTPDEDRPNAARVALLSFALWKSRFAADPGILGRTLSLDGNTTRIVGVLPASFEMPTLVPADILVPLALDVDRQRRAAPGAVLRTFARMKPGITIGKAIASLQPFFEQALNGAPPEFRKEIHLSVRSLRDRQIHDVRLASWLLLGSVFAVLLVACTNLANLLLSRFAGRVREIAVRTALGATRGRLLRQALTESVLLALLGSVVGLGIAQGLLHWFLSMAPQGIPHLQEAHLDGRVLLFTVSIAVISALLFGLTPGLMQPGPEALLGKTVSSTARNLLRQGLVASQIAVSVVLLAGAALLLRSLWNLQNAHTGMQTESVITEGISLSSYRYPQRPPQLAFFQQLQDRLRRLPGITALAVADSLPPAGQMRSTILAAVEVAGRPPLAEGTGGPVGWRAVTPDYFRALAIPIIRGRPFEQADLSPSANTMILSETLARTLFPVGDPLGKQIRLFRMQGPWRTVVGIAADVKNNGVVEKSDPEFYLPWKDDPVESLNAVHILARTQWDPKLLADLMLQETANLDPSLPVTIEAMSTRVDKLAERPRFDALLLSLFAGIAVLLAAIGIYGVVAFLVGQQTREIGVRMALGATPQGILQMVLTNIGRWTMAGAAAGLLGSWLCAHLLESLLFEVRSHDPLLLGLSVMLLILVAFVAAWIPARRAMRVDPLVALRYE